jgi:hypothetical protein
MKKQSAKLLHQPADFRLVFSEENKLIPRLALRYLPVKLAFCPLASPRDFISSLPG